MSGLKAPDLAAGISEGGLANLAASSWQYSATG